jgi:undecaprenyl-diphosphatase
VRRGGRRLPVRHALVLGAVQGPAELLPVSSSGHLVLLPALFCWPYADLDDELRKSFEVALHAGTAVALALALRHEVAEVLRTLDARRVLGVAVAFTPPAAGAFAFERAIEERAGRPRSVALAQIGAGIALALADRCPAERAQDDAGVRDHLLIGLGQAAALVPGVSRNGGSLTAARLRRFERRAASRLSRHAALPIILAASGLKGVRLARRGMPSEIAVPFAAGAAAAFASTLAATRLVAMIDGARSYAPFAAYRVALGACALARFRRTLRP